VFQPPLHRCHISVRSRMCDGIWDAAALHLLKATSFSRSTRYLDVQRALTKRRPVPVRSSERRNGLPWGMYVDYTDLKGCKVSHGGCETWVCPARSKNDGRTGPFGSAAAEARRSRHVLTIGTSFGQTGVNATTATSIFLAASPIRPCETWRLTK
jgi:hypothetical protein